jgi:hypothetical protein
MAMSFEIGRKQTVRSKKLTWVSFMRAERMERELLAC